MKLDKILLFTLLFFTLSGCSFFNSKSSSEMEEIKKGDFFFAKGTVLQATLFWEESLNKKKTVNAYEKIIMGYIIQNDLTSAEKWAKEGLVFFPDNLNILFNNSLIHYHRKEYDIAMEGFDKILALDANYPNIHFLKGVIYEEKGEKEKSKKEFVKELNVNPGSKKTWQKIREEVKNDKQI